MKTIDEIAARSDYKNLKTITKVVNENKRVSDRIKKHKKLGYSVSEVSMGSGGVLQVKELKDETRVQISYGHGKYNYAYAVRLKKNNK